MNSPDVWEPGVSSIGVPSINFPEHPEPLDLLKVSPCVLGMAGGLKLLLRVRRVIEIPLLRERNVWNGWGR